MKMCGNEQEHRYELDDILSLIQEEAANKEAPKILEPRVLGILEDMKELGYQKLFFEYQPKFRQYGYDC